MTQHPFFDPQVREMIDLAEVRLQLFYTDFDKYKEAIVNNSPYQETYANQNLAALLPTGAISIKILNALLKDDKNHILGTTDFLWDCLIKSRVVISTFQTVNFPGLSDLTHRIDTRALKEHVFAGTFQNVFAPPSALIDTYSEALLSIDVEKNGEDFRGSGFISQRAHDSLPFLVTCLHNVNPEEKIKINSITTASGESLKVSDPIPAPHLDLCLFKLIDQPPNRTFRLNKYPKIFDEVYTLGYPNIPGTDPVITGHRGEINAVTNSYLQKLPLIIISNLVEPGSSGCPVLTWDGRCSGMTVSSLERKATDGMRINFSAALPATEILKFMAMSEFL